ncbi:ABC transporter ATP-binding protein/permease [Kribbella sp. NBC_01505]|uniref:ABC transporter ATP-binding protein n=1 Tax=Kribbella sp. NBC_01505 TaxID=2903580 RepID=UPI0038643C5D
MTDASSRYLLHARVLWRAAPLWSTLSLLLTLLEAAIRTLLMVAIGQFVGSLASSADRAAWRWLVVLAILLVTGPVVQSLLSMVIARGSAAYLAYVLDLVAEVGVYPRGIAHLDTADYSGRLRAVVDATRDWSFVTSVGSTWSIIGPRLAGVGAIIVLLPWRWWVPFVVAGSFLLVSHVFMSWISLAFDKLLEATGDGRRRAGYLRGLLTRTESAKEVRLFGLTDWLADSYRSTWSEAMTRLWRERRSGLGPVLLACLVMALVVGGAFALIGVDVVAGSVSLAAAVTMIQAILRLQNFGVLGDAGTALARNTSTLQALAGLRRELGLPAAEPGAEPASVRASGESAAEVQLDHVSFGYPSRTTRAVNDISLRIEAGQSVAIVGVNGAGKSTLIKLLCGLYEPDEGSVRVAGADPAVDETARRRVAVILQDFVRYHLPLRDNVVLGGEASQDTLDRALADAGGSALLDRLEHGWDTVLSAEYDGGTDLSGGQWQRVALARALAAVAGGAGVLVLDEPTAALDVRAEAALFDRFLEVTRGVTTILVSHRLSSVRHADRIVVLADPAEGGGGIVEDGSHDDLMRRGGQYAEMFTLQARRFGQTGSESR